MVEMTRTVNPGLDALFEEGLSKLRGTTAVASDGGAYPEPGQASVLISFSDGTKLHANYWRIIKDGKHCVSSFDHGQIYGLPEHIDAKAELQKDLEGKIVTEAKIDKEAGDLLFTFSEGLKLTVYNFSCYEVWEVTFPDQTGDYSTSFR